MTQLSGQIVKVTGGGGPYAYVIYTDTFPNKVVSGIASLGVAMNGVRDDIAALIPAGEVVEKVVINATSR